MSTSIGDLNLKILVEVAQANKQTDQFTDNLKKIETQSKKTTDSVKELETQTNRLGTATENTSQKMGSLSKEADNTSKKKQVLTKNTRELGRTMLLTRSDVLSLISGMTGLNTASLASSSAMSVFADAISFAGLKVTALLTALYALKKLIDEVNEFAGSSPKTSQYGGDVLGGRDASLDYLNKQTEGGQFFTPEEQAKTLAEQKHYAKEIEAEKLKESKQIKNLGGDFKGLKKEVKEAKEELFSFDKVLKQIFIDSKNGSYGDLSDTVDRLKNRMKSFEGSSGEVRGYYGPANKETRAKEAGTAGKEAATFYTKMLASKNLAEQIGSILGIGADNFVGKILNGLNDAISLAASIAQVIAMFSPQGAAAGFFSALGFASGGSVPGSGSGDSVPAMLTPGEFVINKNRASQLGTDFLQWLNGGGSVVSPNFAGVSAAQQIVVRIIPETSVVKSGNIYQAWRAADKVVSRRKG